jgi:hypothetical protein
MDIGANIEYSKNNQTGKFREIAFSYPDRIILFIAAFLPECGSALRFDDDCAGNRSPARPCEVKYGHADYSCD